MIHEQDRSRHYTTMCGLPMNPMMQTMYIGDKPTCPKCRAALAARGGK